MYGGNTNNYIQQSSSAPIDMWLVIKYLWRTYLPFLWHHVIPISSLSFSSQHSSPFLTASSHTNYISPHTLSPILVSSKTPPTFDSQFSHQPLRSRTTSHPNIFFTNHLLSHPYFSVPCVWTSHMFIVKINWTMDS